MAAEIQNKVRRWCLGLCHASGSMNLEGVHWLGPPRGRPCEFQRHGYKPMLLPVKPLHAVASPEPFISAKVG
ncbi:MAG: hypothetical protein QGH50_07190 [SAR324 cluster bacterium]|nr:hypothetical protein [SAR324 cluster bacterium]